MTGLEVTGTVFGELQLREWPAVLLANIFANALQRIAMLAVACGDVNNFAAGKPDKYAYCGSQSLESLRSGPNSLDIRIAECTPTFSPLMDAESAHSISSAVLALSEKKIVPGDPILFFSNPQVLITSMMAIVSNHIHEIATGGFPASLALTPALTFFIAGTGSAVSPALIESKKRTHNSDAAEDDAASNARRADKAKRKAQRAEAEERLRALGPVSSDSDDE